MPTNPTHSGSPNRIDAANIAAIAAMPVGIALISTAQDKMVCNAELVKVLSLPDELALQQIAPEQFAIELARHAYDADEHEGIARHLRRILQAVTPDMTRRQFATWIKGQRTVIETIGSEGLVWFFVKEQLDAKSSSLHEAQLTAAVQNINQGLVMLDSHRRMVICNDQFARMYSIPANMTEQGTQFEDIEAYRAENGLIAERLSDELSMTALRSSGLDPETENCFIERENGRVIRTSVKPLGDSGTLSTHLDITDELQWDVEIARRQVELETQNMRLDATMDAIPHGLAMFDANHRLVMCNAAFIDINRIDPELAIPGTKRTTLMASSTANGFTARDQGEKYFAERDRAIARGKSSFSELELTDGRVILVGHHPTSDGGWVSFHQDVSELNAKKALAEKRSEELETHNQRFVAAINNMAHGLAMFDGDRKMVVCNEPFVQMYQLPDHLRHPGTHFYDILTHRHDIGMVGKDGTLDDLINKLDKQTSSDQFIREIIDMRSGHVMDILHQPMANGGWVATHQDITEKKRSEDLIARRSAELEQQNMRFTAAVSNMTHGLSMFDAEHNLVVCNQAYAELYDLPEELTRPGTSFWDMLENGARSGMVSIADPVERHRTLLAVINAARPERGPLTMVNGRVIMVLHQPTSDGGWLATHEDITEEHKSAELIEHMAHHDPLTDLPNRLSFSEELIRVEARIRRGEVMAVLCLDLDRFKEVNDTLGHSFGDHVLEEVARRIEAAKREEEFAARMGGDEFMLLLGPLEQPHHAAVVAQRLIDSIGEPFEVEGHQVTIGTSIGIAVAPNDGEDGDALMRNADLALYRAKSDGRGHYCFFEQGMDAQMQERRRLERGLRDALARQEFTLAFQPLLDLESNRVSGFEALLRWSHSEMGPLPPSKFIPIAEETGLIVPLGRWVLRTACETAMNWPEHVHVAVNLSPAQFKDKKLAQSVADILKATGLSPDRLELEITESLLLQNAEGNLKVLHDLRQMGVRISMDDFGTGYSALSYLRSFPFDKIKIDRSFIADIQDREDNDLVHAVIGLGKSLGVMTTAEGVETEIQLDVVRERGCSEVQGFLFSPPLPASAATELLHVTEARAAALAGIGDRDKNTG